MKLIETFRIWLKLDVLADVPGAVESGYVGIKAGRCFFFPTLTSAVEARNTGRLSQHAI